MLDAGALRTFVVFVEDPNLSRAARRLHLSQPAVHAQLRRLAEDVGAPLYRRSGRGLVLTQEGVRVAAFARDVAEREAELRAWISGEGAPRRVVLAAGAGALLHVLGEGMRAFARERDERLDVTTLEGRAVIAAVAAGDAHVGVTAVEPRDEAVIARALTDVPQVLVVPRDHALARRRRVRVGDLAGERMVLPPQGRPQRTTLDAAFAANGITVRESALAVGWELVVHLVTVGAGVAIVNGSVRLPRGLVSRPLGELPPVRYSVFTRARPNDATTALVDRLVRHGDAWRARSYSKTSPRSA